MRSRIFLTAPVLSLAALISLAAACGDDDDDDSAANTTVAASSEPAASAAPLTLADACSLVPVPDAATAAELALAAGVPGGDERRRVCTFTTDDGVGVTVGVQAGSRFDEKADTSRDALGVEGEPVDDLGDEALFVYSDADIPEGVGGTLVAVGDLTIDVTLQGLDEAATRTAANGLAALAVSRL